MKEYKEKIKRDIIMKCCGCGKDVKLDVSLVGGEAQWFGKYQADSLLKIICKDCIKDNKKRESYRNKQV